MEHESSNGSHDADARLASLELERRALLALCLNYDRLLDSVVTSRRWKSGNALGLLAGKLPGFMRTSGLSLARMVSRSTLLRSWLGEAQQNLEYRTLRTRLFSLMFPDPGPVSGSTRDLNAETPSVTIVAVLYNDEPTVAQFLSAMNAQTYAGQIEIVLVDDCSTDASVARAGDVFQELGADKRITLKLLRNASNLGNCPSRNAGLRQSTGDIVFVIDADCIVNPNFVAAHVTEHGKGFGVVIGPMGIECNANDVDGLMSSLLGSREEIARRMRLQDPTALASAVNCVTRNFSVTRKAVRRLERDLFDERFTYRNAADTGFGWEDVEMGASLRRSGATIAFTWDALSIHVSHAPSVSDRTKAVGSARNFALLMQLHPELFVDSRDWATNTLARISAWLESHGIDPADILGDTILALEQGPLPMTSERDIIVYTAITGGYDKSYPVTPIPRVTYLQFNDLGRADQGWQLREFAETDVDPVRTAKKPKVLPHLYLSDADWSVWIDGNIQLLANPSDLIAEVSASGCNIGVFRHPERACVYEEAIQCIRRGKDEAAAIMEHMGRYRKEHFPRNSGLAECNVIVRRHNAPAVSAAMEMWWAEIKQGSRRDQLSFNYALWKTGLRYHELAGGYLNVRTDPRFSYLPHKADNGA